MGAVLERQHPKRATDADLAGIAQGKDELCPNRVRKWELGGDQDTKDHRCLVWGQRGVDS